MKSGQGESVIGHITRQWQLERPDLDLGDFLLTIYLRRLGQLIENEYDRMCQARFGMSARDMRVLGQDIVTGPFKVLRQVKEGDKVVVDKEGDKKKGPTPAAS